MPNHFPTKILPPVEYLRACFDYSPNTGELRWKHRPREHFHTALEWKRWNTMNAGNSANVYITNKHYGTSITHSRYCTHRLIWKLMTGEDPPRDVDHQNGNGLDNRWDNLRLANMTEQNRNRQWRGNATGRKGVYATRGKWRARIKNNYILHHLGTFDTIEEASAAYEAAARKLHGDFYRPT